MNAWDLRHYCKCAKCDGAPERLTVDMDGDMFVVTVTCHGARESFQILRRDVDLATPAVTWFFRGDACDRVKELLQSPPPPALPEP